MTFRDMPLSSRQMNIDMEDGKRLAKQVAEIRVSYSVAIKKAERYKIACSQDVYEISVKEMYHPDSIEYIEFFYILLLNRASEVLGIS